MQLAEFDRSRQKALGLSDTMEILRAPHDVGSLDPRKPSVGHGVTPQQST